MKSSLRFAAPYLVLTAWWLIGAGAFYALSAAEQAAHPPTCFGIGWGCTPDARFLTLGFLILSAPVGIAIATIVGVVDWRQRRLASRTALPMIIATGLPFVLLAGALPAISPSL